ncbi:MAG: hypothetical protein IPN42_14730 [Methylococcaceae bacterium]|nr:hypothetical protein [Methylococcaceae bacterium]
MNINPAQTVFNLSNTAYFKISRKSAFHVAGHAAAIYFRNRQLSLPTVFFQIQLCEDFYPRKSSKTIDKKYNSFFPKLEGGRLIPELPFSLTEMEQKMPSSQLAYQEAFEADIVNLLAGPIAEAKYVALRDDEVITPRLVNLKALHRYGGETAIDVVYKYFECINETDKSKEKLIIGLYLSAFAFVNERANWLAITALAEHILATQKPLIAFEEIVCILESNHKNLKRIH